MLSLPSSEVFRLLLLIQFRLLSGLRNYCTLYFKAVKGGEVNANAGQMKIRLYFFEYPEKSVSHSAWHIPFPLYERYR